ncbi:hypothetical protein E4656_03350 [Natronospirillum operosum]|uniref:J domain-containing protein n=1 Tax=Natronospirillum operosum TaxID=2759953 RepID=A0A4Z0WJ10_9GAMM|nr:J domain-containing protein [Natronospirillum operosum]TGG95473.1 hypothetical protein E4656_03350 [Natronospirillum operosum]
MSRSDPWWQVLDVPPDADKRTIRQAYSRLIKIHRPDDAPDTFARIREAYETARSTAVHRPDTPKTPLSRQPAREPEPPQTASVTDPTPEPGDLTDALTDLLSLLEDWKHSGFRDETCLTQLEAHPALLDLNNIAALRYPILSWLSDNTLSRRTLTGPSLTVPSTDLARLDRLFGWRRLERTYSDVPDQDFTLVFYGIHRGRGNTCYQHPQIDRMIDSRPRIRSISAAGVTLMCVVTLLLLVSLFQPGGAIGAMWVMLGILALFTFGGYGADRLRDSGLNRHPVVRRWVAVLDWTYFGLRHVLVPVTALLIMAGLVLAGSWFILWSLLEGYQTGLSTDSILALVMVTLAVSATLWAGKHYVVHELEDTQVAWWRTLRYNRS